METIYQFSANSITGDKVTLESFAGKVLLIVNTASACGFTPQYRELENLYKKYKDQGFVILGFPCNQFGKQESGTNEEIAQFCDTSFKISFPLFQKIEVNGENAHELYQYLKAEQPGLLGSKAIKWNFTKFLVGREGQPKKRYAPQDKITKIENDLCDYL